MSDEPTTSEGPNEDPLPGLDDDSSPEEVAEAWRNAEMRDADSDGLGGDVPPLSVEDLLQIEYTDPPDSEDNVVDDDIDPDRESDLPEEFLLLASMSAESDFPDLEMPVDSSRIIIDSDSLVDDDAERRAYGHWRPWLRKFRRGVLIERGSADDKDVDEVEAEPVRGSLPAWLVPTGIVLALGVVIAGAVFIFGDGDETTQAGDQPGQVAQQDAADIGPPETDVDTDGDGLYDDDELFEFKTDPEEVDTDGDGVGDGDEITAGTDPLRRPGETEEAARAREEAEFDERIGSSLDLAGFDFNILETVTSLDDGLADLEVLASGILGPTGAVVDQTPRSELILVDFDVGWVLGTDSMVYFAVTGPPVLIAGSCIAFDGKDASGPVLLGATMLGNSTCPEWAVEADIVIPVPVFQSFTFDIFDESTQTRVVFPTPFTVVDDFEGVSAWVYAPVGDQWQYANYWLAYDDFATGNTAFGLSRTEFELMQEQYPADAFDITDPVQRSAHRMVKGVEGTDCFGYVHPQLDVEVFRCDIGTDNVITAVIESP